ncbi:hypothetical protein ACFFIX_24925 [Metabacillus herbersteinensis]|uniref:Uncharacterized protein n=1 Tax=Metabacillus herbersteinensis TaxID=283816 RepID=A0ABV6GLL0_9BACI
MNNDFERELPSTALNPQMSVSTNHVRRVVGNTVSELETVETTTMILQDDEE